VNLNFIRHRGISGDTLLHVAIFRDSGPVHSLRTLMTERGTRCKNSCRTGDGTSTIRFDQLTQVTPFQQHVFNLLKIQT
jgi:hypothetical protein